MAKPSDDRRRRAKSPDEPPPAEEPPAAGAVTVDDGAADANGAETRPSRRGTVVAAVVLVACASATGLLLSGWTPGPGSPQGGAATTAAATQPTPAKKVPRKVVPKRPLTRKAAQARARIVSRDLFSSECGVCHTLAAAGTTGRAGPNLDKLRPTRARVLAAIRNGGKGSGLMSPNMVTGNDAARIAAFVAQTTHR